MSESKFSRWRRRTSRKLGRFVRDLRKNFWKGLLWPFRMAWLIITWPIQATIIWFIKGWHRRRTRDLIFGLPAIIVLTGVAGLGAEVWIKTRSLNSIYLTKAHQAMGRDEYNVAEVYLQRILNNSSTNTSQAEFGLGEVFEETGREERAQWLFRKLAPDDKRGYSPAHRKRAVWLAEKITSKSTSEEIRQLRWHLSLANEQRTPTVARAWSAYYLALNQTQPAIEWLEKAVSEYPELGLLLGQLYLSRQEVEAARSSYISASDFLRKRLNKDPENTAVRVTFANTLLKLGELSECEAVLEVGMKLDPDGPYKQLLASLYTNRHDMMAKQKGTTVSLLLKHLHKALSYDPNFSPAYERLVSYGKAKVEGEESLEEILNEVIARGEEPGLAHFAMSILKFNEREIKSAKWHLERAHRLLPKMPFVSNNLAWILSTEEPVDYERALALIQPAVESFPEEPRLLDTRATILMKLERWEEALDDLEHALRNQLIPTEQIELHKKLAIVCDKINQPGLAEKHRKLAANPNLIPQP